MAVILAEVEDAKKVSRAVPAQKSLRIKHLHAADGLRRG
ncbi:hypothetical protein QE399_001430 [Paracidovorax wautersii]|uniref:Uncharacterized protein n=1 Tax=Paracidovorax wautersii TaxID=1177982 RepID=A0ABU1I9T6_9BURK|nr:hypothetical protein [Paracidovorax wautersii]